MQQPTIASLSALATNLGLRAYDSMRTILQKEGEYYLSHDDLGYALMVLHPNTAVLMEWHEDKEPTPIWSLKEDEIRVPQVVAGFLVQHPEAVISLAGGKPIVLCCPTHPEWKRVYSFTALQEGVALGYREFGCAVPKDA